jgi:hypothetical protein
MSGTTRLSQNGRLLAIPAEAERSRQTHEAPKGKAPEWGRNLESLQSCLFFFLNIKEFVEFSNLENFVDLRFDIAQDKPPASRVDLFVERDELAESGTGQVFDVAEVQEQLAALHFVNQAEELFPDDLNVLLVQDFLVHEINDGHIANVFHFQTAPSRLSGHEPSPFPCLRSKEILIYEIAPAS